MKRILSITIVFVAGIFLLTNIAIASPLNLNRPVTLGDNGFEDSLQEVLDSVVTTADIDAYNDQSDVGLWTESEGAIDSYLIKMLKGDAGYLGIYSATTGAEYELAALADNTASFTLNDTGALKINSVLVDADFGMNFGFFWHNRDFEGGSLKSYTEDSKNGSNGYGPDGNILALSYLVPDGYSVWTDDGAGGDTIPAKDNNDWILAFEDRPSWNTDDEGKVGYDNFWGDGDFNDAVFYIEDMDPVPEPATILLFGAGLLGLVAYGRKKGLRQS